MADTALPLTLVVGSEEVLVDRAVADAVAEARERTGQSPEKRIVDVGGDDPAADLAEALSPTLFSEAAVVIIDGIDSLDDAATAILMSAIEDPPEAVAVVALHPGGVKGKKLLTALRAAGAREVACPALKKGRDTQQFLIAEVRRHGRKATPDALRVLYEAIGHDVPMLVAAIGQLCADVEADPIDEAAVGRYFAGIADVQGYRVADAVWERRPVDALRDLRWVAETSGRSSVGPAVTAALASGLRSVAKVQGMPPSASTDDIMRETGMRNAWQADKAKARAKRWRGDRLAAATVRLAALDVAVKGGLREGDSLDVDQKLHAMETFVVRTASVKG
ncbi:MAG: DNA polymerase III subunit delta, partial [Candidatus Nanopelagicales bacterium]